MLNYFKKCENYKKYLLYSDNDYLILILSHYESLYAQRGNFGTILLQWQ